MDLVLDLMLGRISAFVRSFGNEPETVEKVHEGVPWMMKRHPGAGIGHYLHDAPLHRRLVTVDRTVSAGRFSVGVAAPVKAEQGIFKKLRAFLAKQTPSVSMVSFAIDVHHLANGLFLPFNAWMAGIPVIN
jgi:hypothetical protein